MCVSCVCSCLRGLHDGCTVTASTARATACAQRSTLSGGQHAQRRPPLLEVPSQQLLHTGLVWQSQPQGSHRRTKVVWWRCHNGYRHTSVRVTELKAPCMQCLARYPGALQGAGAGVLSRGPAVYVYCGSSRCRCTTTPCRGGAGAEAQQAAIAAAHVLAVLRRSAVCTHLQAVNIVPHERVACSSHVHPDLVCAACHRSAAHQAGPMAQACPVGGSGAP